MSVQPWKRIEPTEITKIGRRTVVTKTFIKPAGETIPFATFWPEGMQNGAVIALTKDKQVIVARQYRPGPEKLMDEIPGGGIEEGEDIETGTIRELHEETGYVPGHIEYLGVTSRDSYGNGQWHYYLATDCELTGGQHTDAGEDIEIRLISITELIDNATHDKMSDPAAVLMVYNRLKELAGEAKN